ncbi:NusA-like transcription termination signal-binding factor [Halanaeroarchaeum sulfurireducens]|uniref:Probable transcription termination protein NusA n=1 Tax=Halanaeroarchaeum sulfurireducens TaxID=1604004 RepID=A0A0F7PCD0_9EURY|nr:NusA-like transcription termination signal-binding factor [Halanaeroarchaeum sulfurireducens]AKH97003.1 transcription elongation factor NusA-like protein [Halanaeroarchaeum sulfurireducens]ALG81404.1 transcription elongation factor NusA-like protein [Halanaeroarchaeum sulfurireducens]
MTVTLSEEARQYLATFSDVTDVDAVDCVVDEEFDRLIFVVPRGEMGQAIGSGGDCVERLETTVGRTVDLVENAATPEAFVANALAPASVYNVTISENGDVVAYVEVDHDDRGVAIGTDGRNIRVAKTLAARHYGVDDIQLA